MANPVVEFSYVAVKIEIFEALKYLWGIILWGIYSLGMNCEFTKGP